MKRILFRNNIEQNKIAEAGKILLNNGILIHPTENIYGFGAQITSQKSINEIVQIKKKKEIRGFIVLIGELNQLYQLVENITTREKKLIDKYWPGPLTIIFKANKKLYNSKIVKNKSIAIRYVGNPITQKIIQYTKIPIISTSVNPSGEKIFWDLSRIIEVYWNQVDGIVIDHIHSFKNEPSTIVKVLDKGIKIIRQGIIKDVQL